MQNCNNLKRQPSIPLPQFAALPMDSKFIGRRYRPHLPPPLFPHLRITLPPPPSMSERDMLVSIMKKVLSKTSNERRVVLFTGPPGVGKTSVVKHGTSCRLATCWSAYAAPQV